MTDIYVRSTDGDDGDDGSTWALAKATGAGAAAIESAGDTIWFSHSHSEDSGSLQLMSLGGTAASPVRMICGNDGAEPPTTAATTAVIATTGAFAITVSVANNSQVYMYGLTFNAGKTHTSTSSTLSINVGIGSALLAENCVFIQSSTSTNANRMLIGNSDSGTIKLRNCDFQHGATAQRITLQSDITFQWVGGSILSSGATYVITQSNGSTQNAYIENIDLSNCATGVILSEVPTNSGGIAIFRNCKLPASWSGTPCDRPGTYGYRAEMWNCAAGATNYAMWIKGYNGDLTVETTLVKTGGASDGTTPISWKYVATANNDERAFPFITPEIVKYNSTTGSAITVTVDILHDSATNMTNAEIFLRVKYLGTSGNPLGLSVSDDVAGDNSGNFLASAADQASSASTWTTTGMSNPNTQKLSVSFTPQNKGYLMATVYVVKASKTLYIDPELVIS